jgi:metallo-beta-lactamase family protein
MELTFHGAAREVTGSCHIVRHAGKTILLDVGLFQGRRSEVREKNRSLPVPADTIDAIVLSHAHIDHAGRLPYVVHQGYRGPIFATSATKDLSRVMLMDSAHIQEKDAEFLAKRKRIFEEPLYRSEDAERTIQQMRAQDYERSFEVVPGLNAKFLDAGHILGSASVVLEWRDGTTQRRFAFSGDVGRAGLAIIRDPVVPTDVDGVIMESTYGGRHHDSVEGARDRLAAIVVATAARGGRVLIPAFAVGRTQELIYTLHELAVAGRIPRVPVIIDSPLATAATDVFTRHAGVFDLSEPFMNRFRQNPAGSLENSLVEFTESVEASKEAMRRRGPMIVVAASGMVESGRILHHLLHGASDPRNTVLIVGFQAEHTLGRRIVERRAEIRVFGEDIPLRAQVEILNGYSAHADESGLVSWIEAVRRTSPRLGQTWLVHGEPTAQDALAHVLNGRGFRASCPLPGNTGVV